MATSISTDHTMLVVNLENFNFGQDNSVSAVLVYCKHKVLSPYFRLTSFLGWRPLLSTVPLSSSSSSSQLSSLQTSPVHQPSLSTEPSTPTNEAPVFTTFTYFLNLLINWLINLVNFTYTLLILVLIFSAYFLSYCTCYRGDGLPHLLPLILSNSDSSTIIINESTSPDSNFLTNKSDVSDSNGSVYDPNMLSTTPLPIELISDSNTCNNKLISHFVIPDLLHFASYLYLLYLLRTPECERLENLMERGFLQLSQTANWFIESRRLISTLRVFLLLSAVWIISSCILHIVHFNITLVNFNCLPSSLGVNLRADHYSNCSHTDATHYPSDVYKSAPDSFNQYHFHVNNIHRVLVYLTVACLTVFDIICSAIVTSYAVHCQLNISFITSLCQGVREKRITFQEFYQRAEEARKFVAYLNNNQAVCVSLVSIVFICKICLYTFLLFTRINNLSSYSLLIISAILWIAILLVPMIQAVRLTQSCRILRSLGHELKARPFGYQHTDESELNSLLQYTSSLSMVAKLFNLPIKSSSIVLIFSLIIIGVPLLGQINVISL